MLTPPRSFDPLAPLPPATLANIMATGVGQAATRRLAACFAIGAAGAAIVLAAAPAWWLASTPFLCMAAFGSWGLATQRRLVLDAGNHRAPIQRALLVVARVAAVAVGSAAATAGAIGGLLALMAPHPLG